MKTIEEISEEIREQAQHGASTSDIMSLINEVQRWIPVEEELPPIGIEVVVKERFNEHEIYVFNSTRDRLIKCQNNCITHWRQIELK